MIINGGAGGTGSDECTARLADIPAGLKAVAADSNDEAGVGTMALTGNAQAGHVLAGETFYTNDYKSRLTGTMTVNSLLSFSVAAYSGRRVLAKWQNPKIAGGKPYSGVYIRYSTSGNPGKTGGTQIYKGAGNNTASAGQSQAYIDLPALSTKYYLSVYPYVTCSAGEITGAVINATVTTSAAINKTFTASGSYTIPAGYTKMDLFAVGGGSGGKEGGGGGGGGYTKTVMGIAVSSGQVLGVTVGGGGSSNSSGGTSSAIRSGTALITANGGGANGITSNMSSGIGGGSGGGSNGYVRSGSYNGGNGGTKGGSGVSVQSHSAGSGQGTTTRAWGSTTGTLYAGGGGGGGDGYLSKHTGGGAGGTGGGGGGGIGGYRYEQDDTYYYAAGTSGANGSANTGGGGGGGGYSYYPNKASHGSGGRGGSGIVLLKLY